MLMARPSAATVRGLRGGEVNPIYASFVHPIHQERHLVRIRGPMDAVAEIEDVPTGARAFHEHVDGQPALGEARTEPRGPGCPGARRRPRARRGRQGQRPIDSHHVGTQLPHSVEQCGAAFAK